MQKLTFLALPLLLAALPAAAQDASPPGDEALDADQLASSAQNAEDPGEKNVFDGDYVILGVGAVSLPRYDGADENQIIPAAGAIGRVGGVGFRLRGPSLTTDFIPDAKGSKIGFRFGPTIRYRGGRNGKTGDPVVNLLSKRKYVLEAGAGAGVSFDEVLSQQDSLSFGVGARWDISGHGGGMSISPSASYLLPLSKGIVFGAQVSGDFVDGDYADYAYSISPADSIASGLPAYDAKGGFKELSLGAFTAFDLNGNFLDGGFAVGGGVMYSKLFGSAAKTPITRIRGDRNQWMFGAGAAYAF